MNKRTDERYVIGKDFNTKDWFVYDNCKDQYIQYCDTEEEAITYVLNLELNKGE